jgi:pimeloyl-[acyl-carrier protein] methyl ester esterase
MSKIITLSGWGMAHDSLANVTPEGAIHIDYSNFANAADFLQSVDGLEPDVLVGWSQGGQLALRAISEGALKPRSLVLLATPYQFVANKEIKCGMDPDSFNLFYNHFESDPVKTIKRFLTLISLNDKNIHEILKKLRESLNADNIMRWFYWLGELEGFSCNFIDFTKVPKTFAVHGRDDTIVDFTQTSLFKSLIPNYHLEVFDACGHAPHLHNEQMVREIIKSAL